MWKILQADEPDTFVLATNRTETVRDFVRMAFSAVDIDVEFQGAGLAEVAVDKSSKKTVMKINEDFYRPAEVELLIGDASKASRILNWNPETNLEELCRMMVLSDLERNKDGRRTF